MSTEEKLNAEVNEAEEAAAAEAEEAVEKAEEAASDKQEETAEEAAETVEDAADAEEAADEAADAEEAVEEAADEAEEVKQKSHKELTKEAKAEKKAAKAAKEAESKAKKSVSTKTVAIVTIAICVVLVAALVMFLNKGEQTVYEKINDYSKYVTLGKYKGLTYTKEDIKVTKKEIKQEIDNRVQSKSQTKDSKKGTVKDGDNVNISYEGKIDGKAFDGGSAENYTLTIGSGSFIKGFEEGLVGKKVGETVTLDLTFPKDYSKNAVSDEDKKAKKKLDGKDVTFTVTINSKQVTTTPKYDEKFIKDNSKYTNKKDYEASVKKELEEQKKKTAEDTAKQSIWSEVVEKAKVKKYPKGVVNKEKESIISQYKLMAQNYNMEWEDFLTTYMQTTEKDFEKQAKTYGKNVSKQKLVLYAIADKENIKVTNGEYKKKLKELLKNAGMTEQQFKEQYNMTIEEYGEENDFKANFLSEKVYDFLYKNAKAKKAKAKK